MTTGIQIRRRLESLVIDHPTYAMARDRLVTLINDTCLGLEPGIEFLLGPSRSGKTEILRSVERLYPPRRENGRLVQPVLFVSINPGTAPTDLPKGVIEALGLPVPRGRIHASDLFAQMLAQLKVAQVRAILFDEASHQVDKGKRIPPRLASDWFKDLHLKANSICLVLAGLPKLRDLLECNEQLRNRARRPIELMPYRWDVATERKLFAGCVMAFLAEFNQEGCPLDMPVDTVVRHLYAASAGHIGVLSKFLNEVACTIKSPQPLTQEVFQGACGRFNLPGDDLIRPFQMQLEDEHLLQVLVSALARSDLVLPVETAQMELAQARSRVSMRELA